MLLQLRNVYAALYKKGKYNSNPLLSTAWASGKATKEDDFEYFTHPSTTRWALPTLRGKVDFRVPSEAESPVIFNRQTKMPLVKNRIDFLRRHFQPVYEQMEHELESAINCKNNLNDLMGTGPNVFKGSGRAIRIKLMDCFKDPQILHSMVIAQQIALEQYDYRACDLRNCLIGLIDSAMQENPKDTALIETGLLSQLRNVLLNLLSRGNDATALTCLLLAAALREEAAPFLLSFMGSEYDIFSLCERAETERLELGDNLYLTYKTMPNYLGGHRKTDMTLWKYPETMIEKITDIFGYFFYPVQIKDTDGLRRGYKRSGPQVNFLCEISPFEKELAIFKWEYQPDGRYFADKDGYGADNCEEITLYALMDKTGKIVTPFSVDIPN